VEELLDPKGFEPLLTAQQVAVWLSMSLVWVYKQVERGLLPYRRVGEAIRFDPEEIRAYLNQRRGVKRIYTESRNPKVRKKKVVLVNDQEVKNSGS
jgi:excisionase family DNA binding protein